MNPTPSIVSFDIGSLEPNLKPNTVREKCNAANQLQVVIFAEMTLWTDSLAHLDVLHIGTQHLVSSRNRENKRLRIPSETELRIR